MFLHFTCKSQQKESRRADSNRLPLLQLRVITQALQGCAGDCKCRIFRGISFPCLAACCTVLRSRWYQSGIKRLRIARRRILCKRDMQLRMKASTQSHRRLQDGYPLARRKPLSCSSNPTLSRRAPQNTKCGSTSVKYAVWVSAGCFARAFVNVNYLLEQASLAEKEVDRWRRWGS
jgi:hypothetical protein